MWADWVSAKGGCGATLEAAFHANANHDEVLFTSAHLLRRQVQISRRGQLGISGSRRSIDIVSSEYSQQQLAGNQETDHTRSTESSGLTSRKNSPWEHRLERATVELNDEGEHQIEQVAVLSREVEAKNVTDGSDGFGLSTPLGWNAAQHAGLGRVDSSDHVARSRGLDN